MIVSNRVLVSCERRSSGASRHQLEARKKIHPTCSLDDQPTIEVQETDPMEQKHRGKIALITGANKGIGFEVASQLGAEGITVLVGARKPTRTLLTSFEGYRTRDREGIWRSPGRA